MSDSLDDVLLSLRTTADAAIRMNWAPYTKFAVVAAVRTVHGGLYGGSNVEVANISLSKHAEESAILVALADGSLHASAGIDRRFVNALYSSAPMCGSCRQFLFEFATDDCVVFTGDEGRAVPVTDLMPAPFGPEQYRIGPDGRPT